MKHVVAFGHGVGLFSMFTQVLTVLDKFHDKDVIVHWNSNCLYWVPEGWNGSRNVWEYYFEPTSTTTFESLIQSKHLTHQLNCWNVERQMWRYYAEHEWYDATLPELENLTVNQASTLVNTNDVYITSGHANKKAGWGGSFLEEDRMSLKKVMDRHVKVKPYIKEKVNEFANKHMAGKVIGVHYRGTDKHHELSYVDGYDGRVRTIEDYLKAIDQVDGSALVYLATDSQQAYDIAQQRLGSRLINQHGWFRSSNDKPLHLFDPSKSFNMALHGEQVIIDWMLLSRCHFFIHGLSNMSAAVLFAAPKLPHLDVYKQP